MYLYQVAVVGVGALLAAAFAQVPTDWQVSMETMAPWPPSETNVKLGQVIRLKVTIDIPQVTSNGIEFELLSSVHPTVFAIIQNSVSVTVGSNINNGDASFVSAGTNHPGNDQDANGPIVYTTRYVYAIPTVTNDGGSTTLADNQIVITYEVVFVGESTVGFGNTAYTSFGISYDDAARIIVSQLGFTLLAEDVVSGNGDFAINCPSEIEVLTDTTCTLTMKLPTSSVSSEVIVSSFGGKVFVAEIKGKSVGTAFGGFVFPERFIALNNDTCPPPDQFSLVVEKLINIEVAQAGSAVDSTYEIKVDIKLKVVNPDLVGEILSPSITVQISGSDAHVAVPNLTVITQSTSPSMPTFTLNPVQPTIPTGGPGVVEILIHTPQNSGLVYEIEVSLTTSSGAGKLSILAVNPGSRGGNVCPIDLNKWNVTTTSSTGDNVNDGAIVTFQAINTGLYNDTAEDGLKLNLVVMVMPGSGEGDTFDISVEFTATSYTQSTSVTAGAALPYPSHVNMEIGVQSICPDNVYQPHSTASFLFTVKTERDVTSGEFVLEAPIPPDTNIYFAFQSATITKVGANTICAPSGSLEAFTVLSKSNDSLNFNDRAVITLPLMCNMEFSNDTADDEFEIEVVFLINEYPNQIAQRNNTMGGGIKFSTTQVWVFIVSLLVDPPTGVDPSDNFTQTYSSITVKNEHIPAAGWPDYFSIQWSPDNVNWVTYNKGYETPIPLTGETEFPLTRSLTARYVRVVNMKGKCLKDHHFKVGPAFPMYGSSTKKESFMQKSEYMKDGDDTTCVNLPFTDETTMTPFVWVEFPKKEFGITDNATQFRMNITGEGLQCRSRSGPQVTYVVYAKEAPVSSFQGKKMVCTNTGNSTVAVDKIKCEYTCPCTGADQCSEVSIFLMHKGTSPKYKVCEVEMDLVS